MTDTKDLIREIQEHTAAQGGENTATHLLVQAVMALQHQADELAAIGAGGVSGPLLGGTLRTQAQPAGEDAEAAARRSFPKWWNDMGASLCGVDPLASSPPQTYAARGFMGGYVAALAAQAPQQAAPAMSDVRRCLETALAELNGIETADENNCLRAARGAITAALSKMAAPQQAAPAVPTVVTEAMHVAAVKVLQRANGLDGLPQRMLDAMLAAAPKAPQQAAPAGWKLVPLEITSEMTDAWQTAFNRQLQKRVNSRGRLKSAANFKKSCEEVAYVAMLAAAPKAPQQAAPAEPYSIDGDPQGIRATVAEAITGALAFGAQGTNRPPEGHWLAPFWEAARAEAAPQQEVQEPVYPPLPTADKVMTPSQSEPYALWGLKKMMDYAKGYHAANSAQPAPSGDAARIMFDAGWKACARFCNREDAVFDGIVGSTGCPEFEAAFNAARKEAQP